MERYTRNNADGADGTVAEAASQPRPAVSNLRLCQLPGCREPLEASQRRYHSREHYWLAHWQIRPWNRLQQRVMEYAKLHELSMSGFGREAGIPQSTLSNWFHREGAALVSDNLGRIAVTLDMPIEQARDLQDTGGAIAEDRWATQARALRDERKALFKDKPNSREARRLSAASARGGKWWKDKTQTEEHIERRVASWRAGEAKAKGLAALEACWTSGEGRAIRSLNGQLDQRRQRLGNQAASPDEKELREIAGRISERLNLCIQTVLAACAPSLRKRGLPVPGGRRADATRCDQLRKWIREHGAPGVRGYWTKSPEAAEEWRRRHSQGCAALQFAVKGVSEDR